MTHESLKKDRFYWLYKQGSKDWNKWHSSVMTDSEKEKFGVSGKSPLFKIADRLGKKMFDEIGLSQDRLPNPHEPIIFDSVTWDEEANFDGFFFPGSVYFNNVDFQQSATFRNCVFKSELQISGNTKFQGSAIFDGCFFSKAQISVIFEKYAGFKNAIFAGMMDFGQSDFKEQVSFEGAEFKKNCNLLDSTFCILPDFRGAQVNGDLSLNHKNFSEIQVSKDKSDKPDAWAKLKLEMSRMHLHEEEIGFFSKELEARALKEESRTYNWLIRYYTEQCNCGLSIGKPMKSAAFLFFIMTIAYYVYLSDISTAFYHSLKNTLPFIPSDRELAALISIKMGKIEATFFSAIRAFHIILSTIFIFLTGFAIRNRLRIK